MKTKVQICPPEHYSQLKRLYRSQRTGIRMAPGAEIWSISGAGQQILGGMAMEEQRSGEEYWLTSLLVHPAYRRQGLAAGLLEMALAHYTKPVWLFCRPELESFYRKQGFMENEQALTGDLSNRLQRYRRGKALIAMYKSVTEPF